MVRTDYVVVFNYVRTRIVASCNKEEEEKVDKETGRNTNFSRSEGAEWMHGLKIQGDLNA